jgi:hypothetical protein
MVFSLAFGIRDSAKLSACFGMLEHSFLGCKSGFRASDCIQRTGSQRWKRKIYIQGWWVGELRIIRIVQNNTGKSDE